MESILTFNRKRIYVMISIVRNATLFNLCRLVNLIQELPKITRTMICKNPHLEMKKQNICANDRASGSVRHSRDSYVCRDRV